MRAPPLLLMCIVVVAAGCNSPQTRYRAELGKAHAALCDGNPARVERKLAEVERLATKYRLERDIAEGLLTAELELHYGDPYEALAISQDIATRVPERSMDRAQVEEIIAKSAIRQGHYEAAADHLYTADMLYESDHDKQRVSDLLKLAEGLSAYGDGRLGDARQIWIAINDPKIRDSLDRALPEWGSTAVSARNY